MVNWEAIRKAYESVEQARASGIETVKVTTPDKRAIIYTMGKNNPVIRIDIKEVRDDG